LRAPKASGKLIHQLLGASVKLGRAIFLGLAIAVCCAEQASSATIRSIPAKRGVVIEISGQIADGDADVFIGEVKRANASGKIVEYVQLNSAGGKLVEGVKLATAIREGKISTAVGQGAVCASACFFAFAAGDPKFAGDGAQIGVHRASLKGGQETVLSEAVTFSMGSFAKELGVPSGIVGRMLKTSPKQILWLNSQDLHSMGVTLEGERIRTRQIATNGGSAQQLTEEFASLPAVTPQTRASLTSVLSWNDFIDSVAKISAEQNDGSAATSRLCQPQLNNCVLGLSYFLKDGRQGLAVVIQDMRGKTMRREVCEFNNANDVRSCVDWDSGAKHRDVKNNDGNWIQLTGN